MKFEPHQKNSKLESILKFTDQIKSMLEAKSTIHKFQNNIAKYYN